MPFVDEMLGKARPDGVAGVVLPRRQSLHPSPTDWRDEVLYFLLVDRFSDGAEATRAPLDRSQPGTARQPVAGQAWSWLAWATSGAERWQGGTIAGVRSKLDYLAALGVTTLWLSPVFKQRAHLDSYHGYGVADFLDVDPRFGSRRDLVDLVAAAHARGMRIILDVIINHSGSNWAYPPDTPGGIWEPHYTSGRYSFGQWVDGAGQPTASIAGPDDGVWPRELQNSNAYTRAGTGDLGAGDLLDPEAEMRRTDFLSLRDFRLQDPGVLSVLADCYKYWIALTDCDGLRIDTLKHVSLDEGRAFCGAIKEYAATLGKLNFFLVGEVAGGNFAQATYLDIVERNLNAVLDIGEARPALAAVAKGFASAGAWFDGFDPQRTKVMGSHRNWGNRHVAILDDHDHVSTAKLRFSVDAASEHQVVAGVALLLFSLGIPCLYYGTEQAMSGPEENARRWLPEWGHSDRYLREAMFGPEHPLRSGRAGLGRETDPGLPGFGPFGTAGKHVFDTGHPVFGRIATLIEARQKHPALRFGRQYPRPVSLFGGPFDTPGPGEIVAWSRILDQEEVLCVVNSHGTAARGGDVVVDAPLNPAGGSFTVVANTGNSPPGPGGTLPVLQATDGTHYVEIRDLPPSEVLVLTNHP
jgi:glycosidase